MVLKAKFHQEVHHGVAAKGETERGQQGSAPFPQAGRERVGQRVEEQTSRKDSGRA